MILKSQLLDGKKGKYYNQITWVKNEEGSVTQIWDILIINTKKHKKHLKESIKNC